MAQFRARDNSLITVRPLQPDDAPFLVELFAHLGEETRYRRFNESLQNPNEDRVWAEAEQIAHGVAVNSRGLLAFTDLPEIENTPVGGVRYVMSSPQEAEIAVTIADQFQGLGIGTELVRMIVEEARANGLERLVGVVQNDNKAVWSLLRNLPYQVDRRAEGAVTVITVHLD